MSRRVVAAGFARIKGAPLGLALALALPLASCRSVQPTRVPEVEPDPWAAVPEMRPVEVLAAPGVPRSSLEIRRILGEGAGTGAGSQLLTADDGSRRWVAESILLRGGDITRVEVAPYSHPTIAQFTLYVHFSPDAALRLREFTARQVGEELAFVLEGRLLMAARIMEALSSPVLITGAFTHAEAVRIAEQLAPRPE